MISLKLTFLVIGLMLSNSIIEHAWMAPLNLLVMVMRGLTFYLASLSVCMIGLYLFYFSL